jgi:acyl-CoA thioesterase I
MPDLAFDRAAAAICALVLFAGWPGTPLYADSVKIVVLGDSLVAGYGLSPEQSFPARLEAALRKNGHAVEIVNAGVSGDTSAGGLARLDWSVPADADAIILELGANDALRGIEPQSTRTNLEKMIQEFQARKLPVLLAGMQAPPNMGDDYAQAFNAIYAELAEKYQLVHYPFFLDGVAANPTLNQPDGMHPTAEGIDVIVEKFIPYVQTLLDRIKPAAIDD